MNTKTMDELSVRNSASAVRWPYSTLPTAAKATTSATRVRKQPISAGAELTTVSEITESRDQNRR